MTNLSQWFYDKTGDNLVDCATRPSQVTGFLESSWLCGPSDIQLSENERSDTFPLVLPNDDVDISPEVSALSTSVKSLVT